jgi:hypothetical protein
MSNSVKRKKLTKRIALRLPHATWRAIVKQARLHGITPSELVREALEHYQGHLCPSLTAAAVNATIDAVNTPAIEQILEAKFFDVCWHDLPIDLPIENDTPPKAQPPGPPGGAGSASVPGPHGKTEVSVASPKRNRR